MTVAEDKPQLRTVEICESERDGAPNQWWYRVVGANNEVLYSSETFQQKSYAIKAARREHEGRSNFSYVLKYTDDEGVEVKETL